MLTLVPLFCLSQSSQGFQLPCLMVATAKTFTCPFICAGVSIRAATHLCCLPSHPCQKVVAKALKESVLNPQFDLFISSKPKKIPFNLKLPAACFGKDYLINANKIDKRETVKKLFLL